MQPDRPGLTGADPRGPADVEAGEAPPVEVLFAVGQFLFITGNVISYNYATFNSAFPKLFPLDADGLTPFPVWPTRSTSPSTSS